MTTGMGWKVGDEVVSKYDMTDYDGTPIGKGEICQICKVTKSTIHVKDPRGKIHSRYRYFFDKKEAK